MKTSLTDNAGMLRLATVALLLGAWFAAYAGEIEYARAKHDDGEYEVEISVKLTGNWREIYRIATDFEQLSRLSDMVIDSGLVEDEEQENPDVVRRWLITRTCIPFYCISATLVEDITITGDKTIKTRFVPEESDFEYGEAEWQIQPDGSTNTVISFHSRFKPDFWVPPLIGPALVKNIMLDATRQTILAIETIALDE